MVAKAQYLFSVQVDTNWYWNQHPQQHFITVPTRTILHPRLEVNAVTDFHSIPKSVCIHPICLTDSDYDCILEEIGCQDKIELGRNVEFYSDDEEN